jgi:hypothetical protein
MLKIADVKSDDQARVPVCRAVLGFRHGTRGMSLELQMSAPTKSVEPMGAPTGGSYPWPYRSFSETPSPR